MTVTVTPTLRWDNMNGGLWSSAFLRISSRCSILAHRDVRIVALRAHRY
jgi:hypothetical protein